jgi:hypothetical protein
MTQEQEMSERERIRQAKEDIDSEADFFTKFMYDPSLEKHGFDKEKFKHHTSNLVTTAYNETEADKVKLYMDKTQILQNYNETKYLAERPAYYAKNHAGEWEEIDHETYKTLEDEGVEALHAELVEEEISKDAYKELKNSPRFDDDRLTTEVSNRFQEAKDVFVGKINAISAVAAGTKSALLRNNNTTIQEQEQDITRETTTDDPSWKQYAPFAGNSSSSGGRRRRKR